MQPGEVITYRLSPEELEIYRKGDDKGMSNAVTTKRQPQKLTKSDLTKDIYRKLVNQGMSDRQIREKYNIGSWATLQKIKDTWGVAPDEKVEANPASSGQTELAERILVQISKMAVEQEETKKQLNEIREILTQLTRKINSPGDQYTRFNDESYELIRKLLKKLL